MRDAVCGVLDDLFRQGAFAGATPAEAYAVRCGRDTMTQADIAAGLLHVDVAFAPLRPAELVGIRVSQVVAGA